MNPAGLDALTTDTYTEPPQFCETRRSYLVCRRPKGHDGRHGTEIDGVWFFWEHDKRWGTCEAIHPRNLVYCGRDQGHEGKHMAASCLGMILGIWE